MKPKRLLFSGVYFGKRQNNGRITRMQGPFISICYHLFHIKMTEKTLMLMGTPTLVCGLVIWFHKLIFVWYVLIPISQYLPTTWGVYLPEELRLWSVSTGRLDNLLLFSGVHRSAVQKGKLQARHWRAHMPQSVALPILRLGFQTPLRTDLNRLSGRKSRSLGALLQVFRGKKCLFSRLIPATFCIHELDCVVLPLSARTLYPQKSPMQIF